MTEQADTPSATLALYADGPAQLEAVLMGLAESDLDLAQTGDSWTIRQIVHHIADGDDLWKTCIKAALGNGEGFFSLQWYWDKPQTDWAENWRYANRSIEPSLALLRANRHHIVELVQQTPDAWEKSIRLKWPEGEEERITIGEVLEMQASHVVGHIDDIQMIRQAHIPRITSEAAPDPYSMLERLFVYGTLAPGRPNAHVLSGVPGAWQKGWVCGLLLQEGWGAEQGYPGIALNGAAGPVEGFVFSSDALGNEWARLDEFEGGQYERVATQVQLEDGQVVQAFVYQLKR